MTWPPHQHFLTIALCWEVPSQEATDALEFTMYMRRTYDAEHFVNAFDVLEEMGVDSDFVLTVPPKVPATARAIIPTADENTFFDDVSVSDRARPRASWGVIGSRQQ